MSIYCGIYTFITSSSMQDSYCINCIERESDELKKSSVLGTTLGSHALLEGLYYRFIPSGSSVL